MFFCPKLYFLLLALISFKSFSNISVEIPMDEVVWNFYGSKLECELTFNNNRNGKFYFRSLDNGSVYFKAVGLDKLSANESMGELVSSPAPWVSNMSSHVISADASLDKHSVTFNSNVTRLLQDVAKGSWIQLVFGGKSTSSRLVYTVPTTRIQAKLTAFRNCQSSLPNISYAKARDSIITFDAGQKLLKNSQTQILIDLASYIAVDTRITALLIDGHTDTRGSAIANLKISQHRAEIIAQKLEELGVNQQMIEVRAHGSRYPIASNENKTGRAENRRVTIRLVRDDEVVVAGKVRNKDKGAL